MIAGPVDGETILIAEGSTEHVHAAKAACDVAGHYSRPDIFQLRVNRSPHRRVVEMDSPETTDEPLDAGPSDPETPEG